MVKAYFNGESGCHDANVNMTGVRTGPSYLASPSVSVSNYNFCSSGFAIQLNLLNISPSTFCSSYSLASGNNLKQNTALIVKNKDINSIAFTVYPTWTDGKVNINSNVSEPYETLEIFNTLGVKILSINNKFKPEVSTQLDFNNLKITSGVYYLVLNNRLTYKIIFQSQ